MSEITQNKKSRRHNVIIVCDESVQKGVRNYSYFYGGALVEEEEYQYISSLLNLTKASVGLHEMKRTKITEKNYQDYIFVLQLFFTFVKSGKVKMRVMFSPNNQLLVLPKSENSSYFKFYYTFIRNAFSLFYTNFNIRLRLLFDELPDSTVENDRFKTALRRHMGRPNKFGNIVYTKKRFIEEVDSKNHPILQCVDVVTGVIESELNMESGVEMSKRLKAKLKVFEFISNQIQDIHENFVMTETTYPIFAQKGFNDPYKHFVYKRKAPDTST